MKNIIPFIYQNIINDIVTFPRHIVIQSGVALGKTEIIEQLKKEFDSSDIDCCLVRIDNGKINSSLEDIISKCKAVAKKRTVLLIDNLDILYNANLNAGNEIEKVLRSLGNNKNLVVIATSKVPLRSSYLEGRAIGILDKKKNNKFHDSIALAKFEHLWLNPWQVRWDLRLEQVLDVYFREVDKRINYIQPNNKFIISFSDIFDDRDNRISIVDSLIKISGGHPLFLARACNAYRRQILGDPDYYFLLDKAKLKDIFYSVEDDLEGRIGGKIYEMVEWASHLLGVEVCKKSLMKISKKEIVKNRHAIVLQHAGLIIRASRDEQEHFISGLVERKMHDVLDSLSSPEIQKVKSVNKEISKGSVNFNINKVGTKTYISLEDGKAGVELSPTEAKILEVFRKEESKYIRASDIAQAINEKIEKDSQFSENAIRSALQRLIRKFKATDLENLISNKRSRGYIYSP